MVDDFWGTLQYSPDANMGGISLSPDSPSDNLAALLALHGATDGNHIRPHGGSIISTNSVQEYQDILRSPYTYGSSSSNIQLEMTEPVIPTQTFSTSGARFFQGYDSVVAPYLLQTMQGILVPQNRYELPCSHSRRKRFASRNPIYFAMEDGSKFRIENAIMGIYEGLVERDVVIEFPSSSFSVRIGWPGYEPWSRQVKTRDFRNPPRPITKAKLGKEIAKCLNYFMEAMQSVPIDENHQSWRVGPVSSPFITINKIALVGIEQVSQSSWQPILYRVS